jgi:2-hydroxychromene-2-carboxylate isomerase
MSGIDFYFDFASPYGFIGAMQIEAVVTSEPYQMFREHG